MRRWWVWILAVMPVTMTGIGCGITDRQLQDFVYSATVRVLVQTVVDVLEAAIVQGAQS